MHVVQFLLTLGLYAESLGVALLDDAHRPLVRLIEQATTVLHLASELGVNKGLVLRAAKTVMRGVDARALGLTCAEFGTSLFLAIFNGPPKGHAQDPKPKTKRKFDISKLSKEQKTVLLSPSPPYEASIEQLKAAGTRMRQMAELLQVSHITHPLELVHQPHWTRLATAPQKDQASDQGGRESKDDPGKVSNDHPGEGGDSRPARVWDPARPSGEEEFVWPGGVNQIPKWFTAVAPRMTREMYMSSILGPRRQTIFEPFVLWTKYVTDIIKKQSEPPPPPPATVMQTMRGYAHNLWSSTFGSGPNDSEGQKGQVGSKEGREQGQLQNRQGGREQGQLQNRKGVDGKSHGGDSRFASIGCVCPKFSTTDLQKFADDLYSDGEDFARVAREYYHIYTGSADKNTGKETKNDQSST